MTAWYAAGSPAGRWSHEEAGHRAEPIGGLARGLARHRGDGRMSERADHDVADHRIVVTIEDGKVTKYRVRLNVSFKYEGPPAKARRRK